MKIIKPINPFKEPDIYRTLRDEKNIERMLSNLSKDLSEGTVNKDFIKDTLENAISYGKINFKATPTIYQKLRDFYTNVLGETIPSYCAKAPRKIKEKAK